MAASKCRIRICLPRALFRRVAARAIAERAEVNDVIVRAVEADNPRVPGDRMGGGGGTRVPAPR
jgi:hypothetical protein